jgi:hypothetical protein
MALELWQTHTLDQLSQLLAADPAVQALVLTGSLAADLPVDPWCDLDLKVVVAGTAMGRYFPSPTWLAPLGELVAWEAAEHGASQVLRVCLAPFRRLDISLLRAGELTVPADSGSGVTMGPERILWSRGQLLGAPLPNGIEARPGAPPAAAAVRSELERLSTGFWFGATLAIARTVRNDLLVGAHLALALIRDCLVLQMMRRDQHLGTTIHRCGSWGNELVAELAWPEPVGSAAAVLGLVDRSAVLFDRLAAQLSAEYRPRHPWLAPVIQAAIAAVTEAPSPGPVAQES